MIEVPFHKLVVAVWNNKAVACLCAFRHMGVIESVFAFSHRPVKRYVALCTC